MRGDIDILICQLRDGRPGTRASAARALASDPTPLARKDLLRCLNDGDDEVRYWSTRALAMIGDDRLVGRLAAQLDDPSPGVRMVVARLLAERPFRPAIHALLRLLDDPDDDVTYWAGQAVASLGEYALPQLVATLGDTSWKRRAGAARVLERSGASAIPYLVRALGRTDTHVIYWAITLLGQLRAQESADEVIPFLGSRERDHVVAAARTLGELGVKNTIGRLLECLAHPDEVVRQAVIESLARFGEACVHDLTQLLDSNLRLKRLSASLTLAAAGESSLRPLFERVASESAETRYWVVQALERLAHPVAIPVLEDLLDDDAFEVQLAAAQALGRFRLPEESAHRLVDRLAVDGWRVRQALADTLSSQPHLPASFFERPLIHGTEDQRYWITRILGRGNAPDVVPLLVTRFEDPSWPVRKNAAAAISRIGPPASRYLTEVLAIPNLDANMKYWVTRAMVGLGDPTLIGVLVGLLEDANPSVRANVVDALVSHGEATVSALLEALRTTSSRVVREGVARVLVRTAGRHAELVGRMFQFRDSEVNYWASFVLARLGPPADAVLARLAEDTDERIRNLALGALGRMGGSRAVEVSRDRLTDRYASVRRAAIENLGRLVCVDALDELLARMPEAGGEERAALLRTLGQIGHARAVPTVVDHLGHERWDVRRAAIEAAGMLGGETLRGLLTRMVRQDRSPTTLPFLIRAVARARAEEAASALVALLAEEDEVAVEAMTALGQLEARSCVGDVIKRLGSESWDMRRAAIRALGKLGGAFDPALLRPFLQGDDVVLRRDAREAVRTAVGSDRWEEMLRSTVHQALVLPADALFREARDLYRTRDLDGASRKIKKALRLRKRPEFHGLLGSILLEQQQLPQAIRHLRSGLTGGRRDPVLECKLGVAYLLTRDDLRAAACLKGVLTHPSTPANILTLARETLARIPNVKT